MKILFPIIFTLLSISQSFGQNDKMTKMGIQYLIPFQQEKKS